MHSATAGCNGLSAVLLKPTLGEFITVVIGKGDRYAGLLATLHHERRR
jgi:hypothetical protein